MLNTHLDILPEVHAALAAKRPVVALESTIISHGMPYPANLETARACEEAVRAAGAVPATLAVLDGRVKIGVTDEQLRMLATAGDILKTSRRDLPSVVAQKRHGALTVAGTMIAASLAGIRVMATGGIGGVHRGAGETFDISADLDELGRTDVCVVCAGAKSILDIPMTLEVLETHGVPVVSVGQDEFPAFYTPHSGCLAPQRLDNVEDIAALLHAKWTLGLAGGVIVANPIDAAAAVPQKIIDDAISSALAEAHAAGIAGKEVTPFLLDRVQTLTGGRSLSANIALVTSNCALAARIAAHYALLNRPAQTL